MPSTTLRDEPVNSQRGQFLGLLSKSIEGDSFVKLVLAKYHGPEPELLRVIAQIGRAHV